jgi:hypothetical protein
MELAFTPGAPAAPENPDPPAAPTETGKAPLPPVPPDVCAWTTEGTAAEASKTAEQKPINLARVSGDRVAARAVRALTPWRTPETPTQTT